MQTDGPIHKPAESSAPLHELISQRWSPRALNPATEVSWEQLRALAEAARWAASYGNTQPARFIIGRRGDDTFTKIHDALNSGNQAWTADAAALIVGIFLQRNEKGEIPYAEYGLGLAAQNLVLQAVAEGLIAHQMAGFVAERLRAHFTLPDDVTPKVVIAVGGLAESLDGLPADKQDRELAARRRKPLSELVFTTDWGVAAFGEDGPK